MVERANKDRKSRESGQFSIFDSLMNENAESQYSTSFDEIKIPDIKEFNKNAKLKFEKEVLGIYLSGHPLDDYLEYYDNFNLTSDMLQAETSSEDNTDNAGDDEDQTEVVYASGITDGMSVTCGGIVTEIRKSFTKVGNKEMAVIKVEDIYGTFECLLFPKLYEKFKNTLQEDIMLTVKGKLSIRDGEAPVIMPENLIYWKEKEEVVEEKPKSNKTVYIKFDTKNTAVYNKIMLILSMYSGDSPVICKCTNTNQAFKVNKMVNANNLLINELIGVLDESSVVVMEK